MLSVTDGSGNVITDKYHVGNQNPFRYRGYYYDTETGFYYLQSRYYDPETGRFINADNLVVTGEPLGANLFAYCGNNPIANIDPTGHSPESVICGLAIATGILGFLHTSVSSYVKTGKVDWVGSINSALGWTSTVMTAGMAAVAFSGLMTNYVPIKTNAVDPKTGRLATVAPPGGLLDKSIKANARTYYHVTSKVSAQQIINTGQIISKEGGNKSLVYALNYQPKLSQVKNMGARSFDTVIKFKTNAAFEPDLTCGVNGGLRSVRNGPISVFGIEEVGFK